MKVCTTCKVAKDRSEFSKRTRNPDGLRYDCKACSNAKSAAWREANREYAATWYQDNKERLRPIRKAYNEATKVERAARARIYHEANADRIRTYQREWLQSRPTYGAERAHKRRARLAANNVFLVTDKDMAQLYASPCFYCGSRDIIEADHVIPIHRGGTHSIGNLVPACRTCNRSKGSKTITEWRKAKKEATHDAV